MGKPQQWVKMEFSELLWDGSRVYASISLAYEDTRMWLFDDFHADSLDGELSYAGSRYPGTFQTAEMARRSAEMWALTGQMIEWSDDGRLWLCKLRHRTVYDKVIDGPWFYKRLGLLGAVRYRERRPTTVIQFQDGQWQDAKQFQGYDGTWEGAKRVVEAEVLSRIAAGTLVEIEAKKEYFLAKIKESSTQR